MRFWVSTPQSRRSHQTAGRGISAWGGGWSETGRKIEQCCPVLQQPAQILGREKELSWCIGMSKLRCSTFYGLFSCDSFLIGCNAVPRMSLRRKGGCMNKESHEGTYFRQKTRSRWGEDLVLGKSCFPLVCCLEMWQFDKFCLLYITLIILIKTNSCIIFSGYYRGKKYVANSPLQRQVTDTQTCFWDWRGDMVYIS